MTLGAWTVTSELHLDGLVRRGVLISRYASEVEARQNFAKLVGLEPQVVLPGVWWSETTEALIARDAWNAITCEHVAGRDLFAFARLDLPEPP
ncbi:MAG: hypothetical protein RLZZ444_319 [Pseudomonadota bacterium]|jgi:hypothetical protein